MADIIVRNIIANEEIELGDVELDQLTGRDLIVQLIFGGVLVPESQLPQAADGTPTVYALLDKNGAKLEPDDPRKLAEIGYADGDTVRIIQSCGSHYRIEYVVVQEVLSRKLFTFSSYLLERLTCRNLIEYLINNEFLLPESQLPQNAGIPTLYRLVDKNGTLLEPFDTRTLEEIGFSRDDIIRVIYRSW